MLLMICCTVPPPCFNLQHDLLFQSLNVTFFGQGSLLPAMLVRKTVEVDYHNRRWDFSAGSAGILKLWLYVQLTTLLPSRLAWDGVSVYL